MKITEVRTFLMQAGAPGSGDPNVKMDTWQSSGRNWLFVKIYTDEGVTGVGECSGWPRVIDVAVQDLATVLIGEDPADIERLWQKMFSAMMGHGVTGVVGSGAITGIDMALWDIKGKALGTPVWNLLGGKIRDRIKIYGHANSAKRALDLTSRGITAVKTGGAKDVVRKVAEIREAVPSDTDVMVDLAGPPWLPAGDAIALGKALESYDLLFMEDPVAPEQVDQYARIRDAISIPLAAGERMSTIWGMKPLIEKELVDVVQPDTGRAGGITQMRKIAAMAEAHGIMVAPHSGSLGPIAEFAALHFMASTPNVLMLERVEDDWGGRDQVITAAPVFEKGHLLVPDAPGLGVDINEDEIAKYPSKRNVGVSTAQYREGTQGEFVYTQTRLSRRNFLKT